LDAPVARRGQQPGGERHGVSDAGDPPISGIADANELSRFDARRLEFADWVSKKPDRNLLAGKLTARSLYNGLVLWERELPQNIEPDTQLCALDSGRVYVAAGDAGRVRVFDAETGRDLPALDLDGQDDGRVKWLAIENGRLYALLGPPLPVRAPLSSPITSGPPMAPSLTSLSNSSAPPWTRVVPT
jgi:hypothetical protein